MPNPSRSTRRGFGTIICGGPRPDHGTNRPALSGPDVEKWALVRASCAPLALRLEQDALGNMFFRRAGRDDAAPAVAFGSHLDTAQTGGRFDGVLVRLEVMRVLHEPAS